MIVVRNAVRLASIALACAFLAGCGEEEPDPLQDEVNSGVRAALEAQGVPAELADCLTAELEKEFPVDRIEELMGDAQSNPFAAFGPEEQESILKISQTCGGPASFLGLGGGGGGGAAAAPATGGDDPDAYFDCVVAAGSSKAIKSCEEE